MSVNLGPSVEDFDDSKGKSHNTSTHASKSSYHSYKLMPNTKEKGNKVKPSTSKRNLTNSNLRSTKKSFMNNSVAYSTGKLGILNTVNPMTSIKMDIEDAKSVLKKAAIIREKSNTARDYDQLVLLTRENLSLKNTMKQMNHGLTRFVEALKDYQMKKLGKPKYGIENLSVEYKLKSRDAESMNYNKILSNLNHEHAKVKKRLDVVGDPAYAFEVRKIIIDTKQKIQNLEEEKRHLMSVKFNQEKKINKVLDAGQPDAMLVIQKKVQEMTVLFDKMEKINKKLEFQKGTKDEQDQKYNETMNKLQELEAEAKEKGIDASEYEGIDEEDLGYSISKNPLTYERKENIIKQAIETERQKYAKVLDKMRNKLVTVMKERNEVISKIREKQIQTVEIREEVNELMVKSRLISEEDAKMSLQDTKDKVVDLPEELVIDQDKIVAKLNGIIKSSKKKVKVHKIHSKDHKETTDIPTTKNAFNLRKNAVEEKTKEPSLNSSFK